jgi:ketosteroid isomerase-like protein
MTAWLAQLAVQRKRHVLTNGSYCHMLLSMDALRKLSGLPTFDSANIERFARDWETWLDRGDAQEMAAAYVEDAELIGTETPTVHGRAAIEQFWRASSERAKSLGLVRTVHPEQNACDGALGYVRGQVLLRVASARPYAVRFVTLWRRETDGLWRCVIDLSTADPSK